MTHLHKNIFRKWSYCTKHELKDIKVFRIREDGTDILVSNTFFYIPWWLRTDIENEQISEEVVTTPIRNDVIQFGINNTRQSQANFNAVPAISVSNQLSSILAQMPIPSPTQAVLHTPNEFIRMPVEAINSISTQPVIHDNKVTKVLETADFSISTDSIVDSTSNKSTQTPERSEISISTHPIVHDNKSTQIPERTETSTETHMLAHDTQVPQTFEFSNSAQLFVHNNLNEYAQMPGRTGFSIPDNTDAQDDSNFSGQSLEEPADIRIRCNDKWKFDQ